MRPCNPQFYHRSSQVEQSYFFLFIFVFRHCYILLGRSDIIWGWNYSFSFLGWSLVSWRRGVEASKGFTSMFIYWLGLVCSFWRCMLVSYNDDGKLGDYWTKEQSYFWAGYRRNREETSKLSPISQTRKIIRSSWYRYEGQIFYYGGRLSFRWY